MIHFELTKQFLIISCIAMFAVEVIIKVLISTFEASLTNGLKDRAQKIIDIISPFYALLPLIAGIILAWCFLPRDHHHNVSKKLFVLMFIYFAGGDLLIYKYLFKVIVDNITGWIKNKIGGNNDTKNTIGNEKLPG